MQYFINKVLWWIKWPIGFLMLLCVYPAFRIDLLLISQNTTSFLLIWFALPLIATILIFLFIPALSGSFLAITEHEVTHLLFALLTFHKPHNLEVFQGKGGYMSFYGPGNWLITLAPYFFPTFAFVVMLFSIVYKITGEVLPNLYWSVFGMMVGYHLISTILEIHPKQTDFKQAGYLFTLIFLPGVNLIVYGLLFSFAVWGWSGFEVYFSHLIREVSVFTHTLLK